MGQKLVLLHTAVASEIAFSKEDYAEAAGDDLSKAEKLIETLPQEVLISEIEAELAQAGVTEEEMGQLVIAVLRFEEFDSPQWHGSGYYYYHIVTADKELAESVQKRYEEEING